MKIIVLSREDSYGLQEVCGECLTKDVDACVWKKENNAPDHLCMTCSKWDKSKKVCTMDPGTMITSVDMFAFFSAYDNAHKNDYKYPRCHICNAVLAGQMFSHM